MHIANSIILWSCISEIESTLFKYICIDWLIFIKKEGAEKGVRITVKKKKKKLKFSCIHKANISY